MRELEGAKRLPEFKVPCLSVAVTLTNWHCFRIFGDLSPFEKCRSVDEVVLLLSVKYIRPGLCIKFILQCESPFLQ